MHTTAGAHTPSDEVVVQVGDIRDLFVAPEVNPLARNEGEVMGEPALLRVVRRLMAARRMSDIRKLVVLLPGDKMEPGLVGRVSAALKRYCTLKLEDNDAQLLLMRREAGRLLVRGMRILLVCVGISSVFRSETVTFLPALLNNALGERFNVIGWVMSWSGGSVFLQPDSDPHLERSAPIPAVATDRRSCATGCDGLTHVNAHILET